MEAKKIVKHHLAYSIKPEFTYDYSDPIINGKAVSQWKREEREHIDKMNKKINAFFKED